MADDVLLLDRLGLDESYVIGASMGGMIGQILAARHPQKVKKLGLMFTSNNQPLLPPPFPKQLFSLIGRPESTDEELYHSLKVFRSLARLIITIQSSQFRLLANYIAEVITLRVYFNSF
jgi:pimeloyl-ACP methyl ester carboxylesterase